MEGVNRQHDEEQCRMKQVATEKKPPPNKQCPRCESTNTKFCYFNNYKSDQPRYFCKICKRYWTQGGKLRNIPFGGGKRFMKRARDSSSSTCEVRNVLLPSPPPPMTVVGNFNKLPIMNMPFIRPPILSSGGNGGNMTAMSSFNVPQQASFKQLGSNGLTNLGVLQRFNNVSSPYILDQQHQSFPPVQPNGQFYRKENSDQGLLAQTQPNTLNSLSGTNINNNDNLHSIVGTNSTNLWDYDIPINDNEEFSSSFDQLLGCGPSA